jgi:hypothetical protein
MRVRYLSGQFQGYEEDVEEHYGEQMVQFGFAERVVPPAPVSPQPSASLDAAAASTPPEPPADAADDRVAASDPLPLDP